MKQLKIKNLSEHEEEHSYNPVRVGNFWSNNYTEHESNGRIYLKIRPHIIYNLKKSETWKIQLTIAINVF